MIRGHPMLTSRQIGKMKGKEKISMLTAYDCPFAHLMDGVVDMILVGDSLGMVILGYENTKTVTMDDMIRATQAVARGAKNTLIIGDMPIGTYDTKEDALKNAKRLLSAGANAIKIERKPDIAADLVLQGIEVMGHIGLTPQTVTTFRVQGKDEKSAQTLITEAKAMEKAGCFSVVLECIPLTLAKKITETISIPTIGIGAGIHCDGQVLVTHDMLGLCDIIRPKFVKRYAEIGNTMKEAFKQYTKEVKQGAFPTDKESFH